MTTSRHSAIGRENPPFVSLTVTGRLPIMVTCPSTMTITTGATSNGSGPGASRPAAHVAGCRQWPSPLALPACSGTSTGHRQPILPRIESPWVRWRLLTLGTRIESWPRSCRPGSRRRAGTRRRRRPGAVRLVRQLRNELGSNLLRRRRFLRVCDILSSARRASLVSSLASFGCGLFRDVRLRRARRDRPA